MESRWQTNVLNSKRILTGTSAASRLYAASDLHAKRRAWRSKARPSLPTTRLDRLILRNLPTVKDLNAAFANGLRPAGRARKTAKRQHAT